MLRNFLIMILLQKNENMLILIIEKDRIIYLDIYFLNETNFKNLKIFIQSSFFKKKFRKIFKSLLISQLYGKKFSLTLKKESFLSYIKNFRI